MPNRTRNFHVLSTGELRAAAKALGELAQRELPVKASYAVSKNLRVFRTEHNDSEEMRQELVRRHAELDEDGNPKADEDGVAVFSGGAREAFDEEWQEILDEEVEVKVHRLPLEYFGDITLPARLLAALDFMIED